jgi:hypothetical protein
MTDPMRFSAVCAALVFSAAALGCEVDDGSDVQSYTDSAGRSCTVDLGDISLTATCDADASGLIACDTGEPGFVLYDDYDFETMISTRESCTACIDRAAHMTYIGDSCATVECATDLDCLNREGDVRPFVCTGGICRN